MIVERLAKKHIIYAGVENPSTAAEIKVEILGLRNAIKQAEEVISRYEQIFAISALDEETRDVQGEENKTDERDNK